jgi:hypothetical protein
LVAGRLPTPKNIAAGMELYPVVCPDREHSSISTQEHEVWDVLLARLGQLRLAPSGHVIGIDMNVALQLAAARGYDLEPLSELLPAAEVGFVEALCADTDRPH